MSLDSLRPPVALVLSGGGAQGAAQAGAIVELVEAGLRVDLVIATSVGAWNGAWMARDLDPTHVHRMLAWWLDPEVRSLFKGLRRGVLSAFDGTVAGAASGRLHQHAPQAGTRYAGAPGLDIGAS